MILSRRWSRRFWSQAKRTIVPSFLFLLTLGLGSVPAQVASGNGNAGFGGSLGGPDGTNGIYQPRLISSPNPVNFRLDRP
jgi:hypothetical protein